jgi:heptaprenylglyceryl phosphate synthase
VIDPFKVRVEEAVRKAIVLEQLGYSAVFLGSTDYKCFEQHLHPYINAIKVAVRLPVVLHFPPKRPSGLPIALNADAMIWPALLGSEDDYFVWKSFFQTLQDLNVRGVNPDSLPERIFSAALTFGADNVSYNAMRVQPIDPDPSSLERYLSVVDLLRLDMVYLYSRYEQVPIGACEYVRKALASDRVLVVSGGVRSREQIDSYHRAGADFVAFAGVLECDDWRDKLTRLW